MEQLLCPWEAPAFFIYSNNIPTLFFYSHIPAIIVALLVGFAVFYKTGKSKVGSTLLTISTLFSLWCIIDLILWATNRPDIVIFFWSMQILIEPLIYLLAFYLVYLFIKKDDLPFKSKLLGIMLYFPIIIFLPTNLNLVGVSLADCVAIEGFIAHYFTYIIEVLIFASIIVFSVLESRKVQDVSHKKEIRLFGLGTFLFLFAFSWGNIIGSFTENWDLAQAGLIGMPIFVAFLAYIIVRFHTFNIKLFATQALVGGLAMLIGAQFFFIKTPINFVLTGGTFIATLGFGYLLIKSVRREIMQREQLQILSEQLFEANDKLKGLDKLKTEFLSLASHQLRSPLTAINGYTSMLLAGDFGSVSDKQKEMIDRVFQSSKHLTTVVEDLLNVSKIEQGGMKYVMGPFDFEKAAKDLATDLSVTAEKKGLKMTFSTDSKPPYTVNGDMEKIRQVILNLLDNSMKYTKEGSITVKLTKDENTKKIKLAITDTGMGIPRAIKDTLFQKFSRGEGAKMNATGSGLGLYLAKTIIEGHKGRVWAESDGEGKGSTFSIELDAA